MTMVAKQAMKRMYEINRPEALADLLSWESWADEAEKYTYQVCDKILKEAWIILEESTQKRAYLSEQAWFIMELELANIFWLDLKHKQDLRVGYNL